MRKVYRIQILITYSEEEHIKRQCDELGVKPKDFLYDALFNDFVPEPYLYSPEDDYEARDRLMTAYVYDKQLFDSIGKKASDQKMFKANYYRMAAGLRPIVGRKKYGHKSKVGGKEVTRKKDVIQAATDLFYPKECIEELKKCPDDEGKLSQIMRRYRTNENKGRKGGHNGRN